MKFDNVTVEAKAKLIAIFKFDKTCDESKLVQENGEVKFYCNEENLTQEERTRLIATFEFKDSEDNNEVVIEDIKRTDNIQYICAQD